MIRKYCDEDFWNWKIAGLGMKLSAFYSGKILLRIIEGCYEIMKFLGLGV